MASETATALASAALSSRPRSADPLVREERLGAQPLCCTIKEAMRESNSSRGTIYAAAQRGDLRLLKRGRRTLVLYDDLRRWIDSWDTYVPRRVGVRKVTNPPAAIPKKVRTAAARDRAVAAKKERSSLKEIDRKVHAAQRAAS